ncbi:hypothetical protein HMP0015_1163 [Acinetobacter haemolyticus ATCC 19194]|uniref:Uncharacterized protein n=1 Tax=Acinetobacter haemolyticus ATCC 19194 TaxID=707232 RepID=D4XN71_ACIHA|nr:hypothetical protein HMP0015_1163 [Acinetobacter haemolyticus ATCC 19194]
MNIQKIFLLSFFTTIKIFCIALKCIKSFLCCFHLVRILIYLFKIIHL